MLVWDHWHIELSSICALKCPRCPRAEVSETLLNRQLDLNFFQNQIGESVVRNIKKITFCGNDGDPIYCREFIEICAWIKKINPSISLVIVTNGSYKPDNWWKSLAEILTHHDEINWSIDGWDQASNQLYRINCEWHSIMSGMETFVTNNTSTYRVWAAIAFRFNQDHLDQMKNIASENHMDLFQLTRSTKFGSHYPDTYGINDSLCPDNQNLVSSSYRFERDLFPLTQKIRPGQDLKEIFFSRTKQLIQSGQYSGICLIGNKGVFLNSRGEFYPCCWTANRYQHNDQWHKLASNQFNLYHRSFEEIVNDNFWKTKFLKFDSMECQTKCTRDRLQDQQHTSEW
jgi:MoaA/NifB/PqqE/SkfB family radical SAM enzyme